MSAGLRAAADGLLYDVAMCMYVAESLDAAALNRECPATGWTLHQTLEHLTASYERYADAFERRLSGQPVFPEGVPSAAPAAARSGLDGPPVLCSRLMAARARILADLDRVTPGQERTAMAEGLPLLLEVAVEWSAHGSSHALDFAEADPALAADPLVLDWAFFPRLGEDDTLRPRRTQLLARLRAQSRKKDS